MVRRRLDQSKSVDSVLIMSIYSLAVSEMWVKNYAAATTHLRVLRQIVEQIGGMLILDAYVMESVILGTKFLALLTNSVPMFPVDWEPAAWQPDRLSTVLTAFSPGAVKIGRGFFASQNVAVLDDRFQGIIAEIATLWQIGSWVWSRPAPDPHDERWLYPKTQAICYRLLWMQEQNGLKESLRLALLLWLLSITDYMGAKMGALETLHFLKAAQEAVPAPADHLLGLHFWINSVGAMISLPAANTRCSSHEACDSDSHAQANFFTQRVCAIARRLGLRPDQCTYKRFLQSYFYVDSRQGTSLSQLLEAVKQTDLTRQ